MKVGWLSDIHLNFFNNGELDQFFQSLVLSKADVWLLSGDIGEAGSIVFFLRSFESAIQGRIFFILGNHDFYRGSISSVKREVGLFTETSACSMWLTSAGPQRLTDDVALVGDDSWADARFGDPLGSTVELNDFHLIKELQGLSKRERIILLNRLGDEAAARLEPKLNQAATIGQKILILTHAPPFRESTWHRGCVSADDWIPWFSCQAVGKVILRCAESNPDSDFLVLCGHTHSAGEYSPVKNVHVLTADADYGKPRVQEIFEFA